MSITTINPATGEPLADYPTMSFDEVDAILERAHASAALWSTTSIDERASRVGAIGAVLRSRAEELAQLCTAEMGKPLAEARAEVEKCATACDYYAARAAEFLTPESIPVDKGNAYVDYEPLGTLLAIMPWNFPYWQAIRAIAPALSAGNCVLLKHADSTTGSSYALVQAILDAGVPEGVVQALVLEKDDIASVIRDGRVQCVTLTGSTGAGRSVAATAGDRLKKVVLELGGSDAFVVLADADLEAAATWAVKSRYQNAGQSCIAAKRFIVENSVADEFTRLVVARVNDLVVGDPTEPGTTTGPSAREDLRDGLARQVAESVAKGAVALTGGFVPDRPGFFYAPTVLDHCERGMPVLEEEVFGVAVPIIRVHDAEEALRVANDSPFGLGGAIWTSDIERGRALAARMQSGHTAVNGMTASDPRLPFGGVKDSGYGRELSHHGLHEFVNAHTIVVYDAAGPDATVVASE